MFYYTYQRPINVRKIQVIIGERLNSIQKKRRRTVEKLKKPLLVSGLCLVPTNMTTFPLNNVLPNWLRHRSVPKILKFNGRFSPRDRPPSPEDTQQNLRVICRRFSYFRSNYVNSFPKLSTQIYCGYRITIGHFNTIQLFSVVYEWGKKTEIRTFSRIPGFNTKINALGINKIG